MKTIKFKKNIHFFILGLLLLGFASQTGYAQEQHTPYPIIFVHGLTGDVEAWESNDNNDIIEFLKTTGTPLRNKQILKITLDFKRSTTSLSNTIAEDVHLFTTSPAASDLYINLSSI